MTYETYVNAEAPVTSLQTNKQKNWRKGTQSNTTLINKIMEGILHHHLWGLQKKKYSKSKELRKKLESKEGEDKISQPNSIEKNRTIKKHNDTPAGQETNL